MATFMSTTTQNYPKKRSTGSKPITRSILGTVAMLVRFLGFSASNADKQANFRETIRLLLLGWAVCPPT